MLLREAGAERATLRGLSQGESTRCPNPRRSRCADQSPAERRARRGWRGASGSGGHKQEPQFRALQSQGCIQLAVSLFSHAPQSSRQHSRTSPFAGVPVVESVYRACYRPKALIARARCALVPLSDTRRDCRRKGLGTLIRRRLCRRGYPNHARHHETNHKSPCSSHGHLPQ